MPNLSKEMRDLLFGNPFGEVFPPKEPPPPLPLDGRTIALRILAKYISELLFARPGGKDPQTRRQLPPERFQIPAENILVEQPDAIENLRFPAVTFVSRGPADYDTIGLTSYLEENTRDVYGLGTVVQWQSEYREEFAIEIWANFPAERRSILAGLEVALSPTEQMSGIRFRMPDYFDQTVCFALQTREIFDDVAASIGRRRARMIVEMRFNIVSLVNYVPLSVELLTQVDADAQTGEAIELDDDGPSEPERSLALPRLPDGGGCCNE